MALGRNRLVLWMGAVAVLLASCSSTHLSSATAKNLLQSSNVLQEADLFFQLSREQIEQCRDAGLIIVHSDETTGDEWKLSPAGQGYFYSIRSRKFTECLVKDSGCVGAVSDRVARQVTRVTHVSGDAEEKVVQFEWKFDDLPDELKSCMGKLPRRGYPGQAVFRFEAQRWRPYRVELQGNL